MADECRALLPSTGASSTSGWSLLSRRARVAPQAPATAGDYGTANETTLLQRITDSFHRIDSDLLKALLAQSTWQLPDGWHDSDLPDLCAQLPSFCGQLHTFIESDGVSNLAKLLWIKTCLDIIERPSVRALLSATYQLKLNMRLTPYFIHYLSRRPYIRSLLTF
ncbi:MAG: hypothetical protein O3A01_02835 [bacterium]|nr:hypothetical protein [bacterium]